MGWVRIEDGFFRNPKVTELGPAAKLLYLGALCYAGEQMTDGHLTAGAARSVAAAVGVPYKAHTQLVDVGLWHKTGDGFEIHDYLTYQPSREQERRRRDQTSRRVQQHRARQRWGQPGDGDTNPVTNPSSNAVTPPVTPDVGNAVSNPPVNDAPTPTPTPTPIHKPSSSTNDWRGNRPEEEEGSETAKAALELLAHRDLTRRQSNTTLQAVTTPDRWYHYALQRRTVQHRQQLADIDPGSFDSPETLADLLDPPPKPVQTDPLRPVLHDEKPRCDTCQSTGWIETETGANRCPNCNP